ncbi:glycosyltransferase family 2 protein [Bacillus mycoides]|uniref:Glycosyltransferase family 2 protein n=1 Tax=Bacillus mycoides TaxID=1405 RepID=A0A4U3AE07_BACMY|nr:glycosyltransferase family 2 protein [Bacillus mycoides]TKI85340.1 glycosyltransferase family 2 protein [Bacillus mycoides]
MNKKISLILPTLGEREEELKRLIDSLNKQVYKNFEVVFVTQDNHNELEKILEQSDFKYIQVRLNRKGLSFARNEGMKHIKGEIVTFSDDDCWYPKEALKIMNDACSEDREGLVCFQIYDPISQGYFKRYKETSIDTLEKKDIFKISSIEIAINLRVVNKKDVIFDEQFGLGARYRSGEENILLLDLVKKGFGISYKPRIVVYHKKSKLTGRNAISVKEFASKGPLFRRMFNLPIAFVILSMFFVKKFKRIESPFISYLQALKEAILYKK